MPELLRPHYEQLHLLPPALEDWIPADHPARFVREFVAALDLPALGVHATYGGTGRPAYDPAMLLALWLYGYLEHHRSSRRLERACYNDVGALWLSGQFAPDHNTLAALLRTHRPVCKKLLTPLVQVAAHLDLVGLVVHALDGTKLQAACSKRGAWHRETVLKALVALEAEVEALLAATEAADATEVGEVRLPAALADAQTRQTALREVLAQLDAAGTDHLQGREPDARMMKGGDGRTVFAYTAQAVVDATSGFLVAQDVVTDAADHALLPPLLAQVDETLGATAEENLADGGYQSGEAFATLETQGRSALVNLEPLTAAPDLAFAKDRFTWDGQQYVCPHGHALPLEREKTKKRKRDGSPYRVTVYRCGACAGCPDRDRCTRSRTGRTIERTAHDDAYQRMRAKGQTPDNRLLLRWRGALIERIFGQIKHLLGVRRFTVAGLESVRAQWALVCTTVNLQRLRACFQAGRFTWAAFRAAGQATLPTPPVPMAW